MSIDKAGGWTIWLELCGSGDMAEATKCGWFVRVSHSRDHKSSDFLQYFFLKKVRRKIYSLRLNHPLSNDFTFSFWGIKIPMCRDKMLLPFRCIGNGIKVPYGRWAEPKRHFDSAQWTFRKKRFPLAAVNVLTSKRASLRTKSRCIGIRIRKARKLLLPMLGF
jgi:hypothetical protein